VRREDLEPEPSPALGPPKRPAPPAKPEWEPVPDKPNLERATDGSGRLRTNIPENNKAG
jgi:hypothetical protein